MSEKCGYVLGLGRVLPLVALYELSILLAALVGGPQTVAAEGA